MRVIIIEDKDCKALVDRLEFSFLTLENRHEKNLDEIRRKINYDVITWLNEQGWRGH